MSTPLVSDDSSDYSRALAFLLRRINYERTLSMPYHAAELKLERMRRLLNLVGDPHLGLKAVHIAGTKGKGSSAAMAAAILRSAGYQTGLYTSPHLEQIEERIVIDGEICSAADFAELAALVQPAVETLDAEAAAHGSSGPTFFEVTTAMAFLHFARQNVDAAVLEVGLGGRLDSTNVCLPEVCLITNISFDHVKQLGNTLALIAGEKAGIIKPGVPVVSGVIVPEPREVIASRAAEMNAPLFQRGVAYDFRNSSPETVAEVPPSSFLHPPSSFHHSPTPLESLDYFEPAAAPQPKMADLRLNLLGHHQAANAAGVVCAVNRLRERGWSISDEAIYQGLAGVHCDARMEQVGSSPTVILDVAHNVASIEALATVLRERFSPQRKIAIFASSKDKDYAGMLRLALGAFDVVILTQYINNPRAMEAEGLLKIAQELRHHAADGSNQPVLHATVRPADAWRLAQSIAHPADLICITGSFFLAAELRPLVKS
jgi:dihydrofolate synthase/folylpolyglutamate synthase